MSVRVVYIMQFTHTQVYSADATLYKPLLQCITQIFEYNGGAIIAMAGKDCVVVGSDLRLGVQFQTLATDYKKVHRIHDRLVVGLAGLATDAETLYVDCVVVLYIVVQYPPPRTPYPATSAWCSSTTCTSCGRSAP